MAHYEILDHGVEHAQYFQGCGTAFTDYDICVTGVGVNAKDAYEDARGQIYEIEGAQADRLHLPTRPRGIRKRDAIPADADEEVWYYVSILYTLEA